jgi:hypothetical protein
MTLQMIAKASAAQSGQSPTVLTDLICEGGLK